MSNPFFIVGSGRSGTTLLRLMLGSHSQITIPPETWFIIPLVRKIPIDSVLTTEKVTEAVEIITSHYRWPDMGIDKKEFYLWTKELSNPTLKDILDLIYDHHLRVDEKLIWGDKTPPYIQIVPELSIIYPKARFIVIIRDGRDVAKSFQDKKWNGKWLFKNTREWKEAINHYNEIKNLDLEIVEVKYEDLVINTEETIKSICAFLDIAFEPAMLDWTIQAHSKIPERELHIHNKINKKPNESDVQRWKKELSPIQTLVIESYLSNELELVGYELKYRGINWVLIFFLVRLYCSSLYYFISGSKKIYRYFKYDNPKYKNLGPPE